MKCMNCQYAFVKREESRECLASHAFSFARIHAHLFFSFHCVGHCHLGDKHLPHIKHTAHLYIDRTSDYNRFPFSKEFYFVHKDISRERECSKAVGISNILNIESIAKKVSSSDIL